jgi:hypothetical protein
VSRVGRFLVLDTGPPATARSCWSATGFSSSPIPAPATGPAPSAAAALQSASLDEVLCIAAV